MKCFHPFQTKLPAKVVVTTEVHGAQAECSGAQAAGQAVRQAVGQALTTKCASQAAVQKGARKSVALAPSGTVKVSQVCCQFSEREMVHFTGERKHFGNDHLVLM